ncbi:Threonylcarbamoyl-AMP synthase [Acropora cervicornis]|uniref:Threonylcarbamoyl-AMP synthase n=1 Tax=Acropora cervicornis TaxID=6130 RepID=A0AAD9R0G6_ACRCE|nr:Threonylcarbamoyl-AMP synthase [Acropora cervicornis]
MNSSVKVLSLSTNICQSYDGGPPECGNVLDTAVASLKNGNVIALPTDTIYGVAALAQSTEAVKKLYQIKKRHEEKPVAICVGNVEDVYKWGKVTIGDDVLQDLLPGPVTLVFERTEALNPELNPTTQLVGIRIPDHEFVRQLSLACNEPLALTSANVSTVGQSSLRIEWPLTILSFLFVLFCFNIAKEFKDIWSNLDLILDGGVIGLTEDCRKGSTVVNLSVSGKFSIIREGR